MASHGLMTRGMTRGMTRAMTRGMTRGRIHVLIGAMTHAERSGEVDDGWNALLSVSPDVQLHAWRKIEIDVCQND